MALSDRYLGNGVLTLATWLRFLLGFCLLSLTLPAPTVALNIQDAIRSAHYYTSSSSRHKRILQQMDQDRTVLDLRGQSYVRLNEPIILDSLTSHTILGGVTWEDLGVPADSGGSSSSETTSSRRSLLPLTPDELVNNTVVDCAGAGTALIIRQASVIIHGVTFQNCADTAVVISGPYDIPGSSITNPVEPVQFHNCVFQNNAGLAGGAVHVTNISIMHNSAVTFYDCSFVTNRADVTQYHAFNEPGYGSLGGGAVYAEALNNEASVCTGNGELSPELQNVHLYFSNCTFDGNEAMFGGAVMMVGHAAVIDDTSTAAAKASLPEGAQLDVFDGGVLFEDCTFVGNKARHGSAVFVTNQGRVWSFSSAFKRSEITYYPAALPLSSIVDEPCGAMCTSIGTKSGGMVKIHRSLFEGNGFVTPQEGAAAGSMGVGGAVGLASQADNATFVNCTFRGNMALKGGSVYMDANLVNTFRFEGCVFEDNFAGKAGGAICVGKSYCHLLLQNSTLQNNRAEMYGGAISATTLANLSLMQSLLLGNSAPQGGAVNEDTQGTIVSLGTTFLRNSATSFGGAISAGRDGDIVLQDSMFEGNQAGFGAVMECTLCNEFTVTGCTFQHNVGRTGGALAVRLPWEECSVSDSVFRNNTASLYSSEVTTTVDRVSIGLGGAIAATLSNEFNVNNCSFDGNRATSGGAIFVSQLCGLQIQTSCGVASLNLDKRSVFLNNEVYGGGGGAIYTSTDKALIVECGSHFPDTDMDDYAVVNTGVDKRGCPSWAGNRVASPDGLGFGDVVASSLFAVDLFTNNTYVNFTSSGYLPVRIGMKDLFGNLITTGTSQSNMTSGLAYADVKDPGADAGNSTSDSPVIRAYMVGSATETSVAGVMDFDTLRYLARINSTTSVRFSFTAPDDSPYDPKNITSPAISVTMRACKRGEHENNDKTQCVLCQGNMFSFNPLNSSCDQCPPNALCNSTQYGDLMIPERDYWHSHPFSPQIHKCPRKNQCNYPNRVDNLTQWQNRLSMSQEEVDEAKLTQYYEWQCDWGYAGVMCSICSPGYGMTSKGECSWCPNRVLNTFYYILSYGVTVIMVLITIRSAMVRQLTMQQAQALKSLTISRRRQSLAYIEGMDALKSGASTTSTILRPSAPSASAGAGQGEGVAVGADGEEAEAQAAPPSAASPAPGARAVAEALEPLPAIGGPRATASTGVPLTEGEALPARPRLPRLPSGQVAASTLGGSAPSSPEGPGASPGAALASGAATPAFNVADGNAGTELGVLLTASATPSTTAKGGKGGHKIKFADVETGPEEPPSPEFSAFSPTPTKSRRVPAGDADGTLPLSSAPSITAGSTTLRRRNGAGVKSSETGTRLSAQSVRQSMRSVESTRQRGLVPTDQDEDDDDIDLDSNPAQRALSVVIKILVNYFQIVSLMRKVDLQFPTALSNLLNGTNQASSATTAVSLDCSLSGDWNKAVQKTIINSLLPVAFAALLFPMWLPLYASYKRSKTKAGEAADPLKPYLMKRWMVTLLAIVFYLYPSVCDAVLSIFSCPNVDVETGNIAYLDYALNVGLHWSYDLNLRCYKGQHLALALILGLPMVVFFALGVPLGSCIFLSSRKQLLTVPSFAGTYSFLYQDYKRRAYFWESVIMLRKLLVVAVLVFFSFNLLLQLVSVMLILAVALATHLVARPYALQRMNHLEAVSLVVSILAVYMCTTFTLSDLPPAAAQALSILLVLLNIGMVVYFAVCLVREFIALARRELDKDGDGTVTPDEIRAYLREKLGFIGPIMYGIQRKCAACCGRGSGNRIEVDPASDYPDLDPNEGEGDGVVGTAAGYAELPDAAASSAANLAPIPAGPLVHGASLTAPPLAADPGPGAFGDSRQGSMRGQRQARGLGSDYHSPSLELPLLAGAATAGSRGASHDGGSGPPLQRPGSAAVSRQGSASSTSPLLGGSDSSRNPRSTSPTHHYPHPPPHPPPAPAPQLLVTAAASASASPASGTGAKSMTVSRPATPPTSTSASSGAAPAAALPPRPGSSGRPSSAGRQAPASGAAAGVSGPTPFNAALPRPSSAVGSPGKPSPPQAMPLQRPMSAYAQRAAAGLPGSSSDLAATAATSGGSSSLAPAPQQPQEAWHMENQGQAQQRGSGLGLLPPGMLAGVAEEEPEAASRQT